MLSTKTAKQDLGALLAGGSARTRKVLDTGGEVWACKGTPTDRYRPRDAGNESCAHLLATGLELPVLPACLMRCPDGVLPRPGLCFGTSFMPDGTFERRLTPDALKASSNRDQIYEVAPFAVELRGGDPVISERLRA